LALRDKISRSATQDDTGAGSDSQGLKRNPTQEIKLAVTGGLYEPFTIELGSLIRDCAAPEIGPRPGRELEDFRKQLRLKKTGRPVPVIQKATVLESITPFVPSKFLKKKYTIEDHVRDELAHRGIECLESIEVFNHQGHEGREKLIQKDLLKFIRTRRKTRNTRKLQPPAAHAYGLRLSFNQPQGPIALGYASHFGLGLFAPPERKKE